MSTIGGGSALLYSAPHWTQPFQKSGLSLVILLSHCDLSVTGNAHLVSVIGELGSYILVSSNEFVEGIRVDHCGQWLQFQR